MKLSIINALVMAFGLFFGLKAKTQDRLPEPWVSYPSANVNAYGVYHFRKIAQFDEVPDQLIIHISADNRYHLYVNGNRICYGPAKGDLQTYKYDAIDIAPYLISGNNVLAALVYNAGKDKPMSFLSAQTAFLFRAEDESHDRINSDKGWKVYQNPAYKPVSYYEMLFKERWFYGFYACGPGDDLDASIFPWGWETQDFDDSDWVAPEILQFEGNAPWRLVPRNIPFMDDFRERPGQIRLVEGMEAFNNFLESGNMSIPPHSKAKVLIDFEDFTMGYPELTVSGGKGSQIQIKYAEALYDTVNIKAHRDSVTGKTMYGVWDIFRPDGERRIFRPLWKRAFRYVQLVIETKDEELLIHRLENEFSGYPYPDMATFESDDKRLNEIFRMGLRTLRMCSGETYYDTPFYEQLSYGGDNRPIAAISTYNSTDDRLLREVLRLYPQSENRETGLFKSAYPSRFNFDMGSWSLAWIQGLHDYYFMRGDSTFIIQFIDNIEKVLGFYDRHIDESLGILGSVNNQNFMDWSITRGSIPRRNDGNYMTNSTMLTMYYVHTLDCTVRLFEALGMADKADSWNRKASRIKSAVYYRCYDRKKGLFMDHPGEEVYSQHTNLLAILCDLVSPRTQREILDKVLSSDIFEEYASSYFSFFLFLALEKTGQEDLFLENLDFWQAYIDRGHTTCGETGFASHDRSDCHAWSAHPSYFLLRFVCGLKPAETGFHSVKIEPHLGDLRRIEATIPHPMGKITMKYETVPSFHAEITLPEGLFGEFVLEGKSMVLKEGLNVFK